MISNRISVDDSKKLSVVILGKVERWKESLLLYWLLAWSFCGSVFAFQFFGNGPFQYSIPMLIMLLFFLYFEIKILKVFFYRRKGFELIKFGEEDLLIQNTFISKGKSNFYKVNEIENFYDVEYSSNNFFSFMEDSFWVIGGQRIYFTYKNKKITLGIQLNEVEVKRMLSLLNAQLKKSKKELRMSNKLSKDRP